MIRRKMDSVSSNFRYGSDSPGLSYINGSALDDCGLIFVSSSDALSKLVLGITKQEFSSVGFYYHCNMNGRPNINVILIDLFRSCVTEKEITLDQLLRNPLLNAVAVKRLKPISTDGVIDEYKTRQHQANFRSAIAAAVSSKNARLSMRDWLLQLFGHTNSNNGSGIGLVNSVVRRLGKTDLISPSDTISLNTLRRLDMIPSTPDEVMGVIASGMNQMSSGCQISSYVVDNPLFGDLLFLRLPNIPSNVREEALRNSAKVQGPLLSQAFNEFMDLLFNDPSFFNTIVEGIREGRSRLDNNIRTLKEALEISADNRVHDLQRVVNLIISGKVDSSQLQQILTDANDDRLQISKIEGFKQKPDLISIPSMDPNLNVAMVGELKNLGIEKSIINLHQIVSEVCKQARSGTTSFLDINRLIEHTNILSSSLGIPLNDIDPLPEDTSFSVVASSSSSISEEASITLSSGDEVIIPLRGCDLSSVERSILLDILAVLDDSMDSVDSSEYSAYDSLRSKITEQLSSM